MASKIVLITGANTGIGYETVKALCQSEISYKIFLSGRNLQKVEAAVKSVQSEIKGSSTSVIPLQLDIADDASIEAAFQKLSEEVDRLDVLVNNAGASFDLHIAEGKMTTREAWNTSWDTNVTGTHIVTETFMPLLFKSSDPRLIFLTSGTASLQESENSEHRLNIAPEAGWPKPPYRSITSYRSTKVGLNMVMREWVKILGNDHVKVFAVAPGFLATGLGGEDLKKLGAGPPHLGGEALKKVIEGHRDADVGKIVRQYSTPVQPW